MASIVAFAQVVEEALDHFGEYLTGRGKGVRRLFLSVK
jgi:hypothetical protein